MFNPLSFFFGGGPEVKTNHTNLVNLRCMRKQEPPSLGTATLKVGEFFFGFDPVVRHSNSSNDPWFQMVALRVALSLLAASVIRPLYTADGRNPVPVDRWFIPFLSISRVSTILSVVYRISQPSTVDSSGRGWQAWVVKEFHWPSTCEDSNRTMTPLEAGLAGLAGGPFFPPMAMYERSGAKVMNSGEFSKRWNTKRKKPMTKMGMLP